MNLYCVTGKGILLGSTTCIKISIVQDSLSLLKGLTRWYYTVLDCSISAFKVKFILTSINQSILSSVNDLLDDIRFHPHVLYL